MTRRLRDLAEAWRGQTVMVAASGPSQTQEDVDYARDRCPVVVLNSTWRLAPWAAMLYACDKHWWRLHSPKPDEFKGVRVIGKGAWTDCESVGVIQPGEMKMYWGGKRIGGGWNSGFQVLNLLAVWKVARVIFTGLDCKADHVDKPHWHGKYKDGVCNNPAERQFTKWIEGFKLAAPQLKDRGIEVINASRDTALTCFPRLPLREVL